MPKINQEEYEVLKEIKRNGFEEIRRNSTGDIGVRVIGEKITRHQYQTKHNDKFKFLEETGEYCSIAELIEEYEYSALERHVNSFKELSNAIRTKESEEAEVKDIKWARREVAKLFPGNVEAYVNQSDKTKNQLRILNKVQSILDQLDEPEVLSQEWIDENTYYVHDRESSMVYAIDLQNLLVPKQELPVIPKFVADWIEKYVEYGYDLYPALKKMENNARSWERTYDWYRNNTLEFVLAYLTQEYEIEVEEEQKYYVLFGNQPYDDNWTYALTNSGSIEIFEKDVLLEWDRTKLTEQEIKDYDERYWPFAVKVEELEE